MLSMKAKYGLRATMFMAQHPQDYLQARIIAEKADVPLRFLEAILLDLRRNGVIETRRGALGGYRLARPPKDIPAGLIIRILDGMVAPLKCASVFRYEPCEDCADPPSCRIRALMLDVRNEIAAVLDSRSLENLVKNKKGEACHATA